MNSLDISKTIFDLKIPFSIQELYEILFQKYQEKLTNSKVELVLKTIDSLIEERLLEKMNINDEDKYFNQTVTNYPKTRIKIPSDERKDSIYYQSDFTSFEFMYLLTSLLKSLGVNNLNPYDLEQFIIECKEKNLFTKILNEFEVIGNENDKYTLKLYNAFNDCENAKLLIASKNYDEYTIPEEFPKTYSKEMIFKRKVNYIGEMLLFIREYSKYLSKNNQTIQKINK